MEAFTFGFDMPNLFTSGPALNNFIDASVLPDFPAVNYTKVDFSAVDIRALILELERGLKEYNTSHHATYCCSRMVEVAINAGDSTGSNEVNHDFALNAAAGTNLMLVEAAYTPSQDHMTLFLRGSYWRSHSCP